MNMFKKNGGFTLVELIVVIAILAILAGVAVPAYTGYIAKAEQAADLQMLSAVNTAAQGLAVGELTTVSTITVESATDVTVVCADATVDISDEVLALAGPLSFTDNFAGASWSAADGWTLN